MLTFADFAISPMVALSYPWAEKTFKAVFMINWDFSSFALDLDIII